MKDELQNVSLVFRTSSNIAKPFFFPVNGENNTYRHRCNRAVKQSSSLLSFTNTWQFASIVQN